ncbi:hypothetical protein BRADI_3g11163v3, partial [Brachypodium distachyon]
PPPAAPPPEERSVALLRPPARALGPRAPPKAPFSHRLPELRQSAAELESCLVHPPSTRYRLPTPAGGRSPSAARRRGCAPRRGSPWGAAAPQARLPVSPHRLPERRCHLAKSKQPPGTGLACGNFPLELAINGFGKAATISATALWTLTSPSASSSAPSRRSSGSSPRAPPVPLLSGEIPADVVKPRQLTGRAGLVRDISPYMWGP